MHTQKSFALFIFTSATFVLLYLVGPAHQKKSQLSPETREHQAVPGAALLVGRRR